MQPIISILRQRRPPWFRNMNATKSQFDLCESSKFQSLRLKANLSYRCSLRTITKYKKGGFDEVLTKRWFGYLVAVLIAAQHSSSNRVKYLSFLNIETGVALTFERRASMAFGTTIFCSSENFFISF